MSPLGIAQNYQLHGLFVPNVHVSKILPPLLVFFYFQFFLFLLKVEKLPLLDKVFRDFMTNIAKYREPKRNPENLFWTMYEEYDSVFLSPKSKSGDTYCTR